MSNSPKRPLRARQPEEKRQRREDILGAAEKLWLNMPYAEISMNHVAREAQLAKGTLYLYFSTKEELFLELLREHILKWLRSLREQLEAKRPLTADALADVLLANQHNSQSLRRLLVLLGTVIDFKLEPELAKGFRRQLVDNLQPVLDLMPFSRQTNSRILQHIYALNTGWYLAGERHSQEGDVMNAGMLSKLYPEIRNLDYGQERDFACRVMIHTLAKQDEETA